MTGKIYLVDDAKRLTPMNEEDYINEGELQKLLAQYWDLLPGDQMGTDEPRRWLFIGREVGVAGGAGEADWLSLDHLFIDQDAVPTFVECKRSVDTRARRTVVAQMLDYAANGTAYWSVERLRQTAGETAARQGKSLDQWMDGLLLSDDQADIDSFWHRVADNLKAGRVRLIFVLDEASRELKRLVEFLNEQMEDVDLFILEVKQFKGPDGQHALVPRISGYSERAKQRRPSRDMTVSEVLAALEARSPAERKTAERLHRLFMDKGAEIVTTSKGFAPRFDIGQQVYYPWRVSRNGSLTVWFMYLRQTPGFRDDADRIELLRRLNAVLPEPMGDNIVGKPSFPLTALAEPKAFEGFGHTLDWLLARARGAENEGPTTP